MSKLQQKALSIIILPATLEVRLFSLPECHIRYQSTDNTPGNRSIIALSTRTITNIYIYIYIAIYIIIISSIRSTRILITTTRRLPPLTVHKGRLILIEKHRDPVDKFVMWSTTAAPLNCQFQTNDKRHMYQNFCILIKVKFGV